MKLKDIEIIDKVRSGLENFAKELKAVHYDESRQLNSLPEDLRETVQLDTIDSLSDTIDSIEIAILDLPIEFNYEEEELVFDFEDDDFDEDDFDEIDEPEIDEDTED